ncbi:hypothetical protein MASR2M17_23440 [Aminivibrio sp.]
MTLVTALMSAITNEPIASDVAMTGEITLRGRVMPVGGIKEKILAAVSHGVNKVLIPAHNAHDLDEIPELRKRITVRTVEAIDEIGQEVRSTTASKDLAPSEKPRTGIRSRGLLRRACRNAGISFGRGRLHAPNGQRDASAAPRPGSDSTHILPPWPRVTMK